MDFTYDARISDLAARARKFVDEVVIPVETQVNQQGGIITLEQLDAMRAQAKAAGLWAPTMPPELGGLGLTISEIVPIFEAIGRSLLGPLAINANAPDEGNMHLLQHYANAEQRERYLAPLVQGAHFSAFSMTEPPPGAGSDPTMLQTTATRDGDDWIINGRKWYTTNGEVAAFLLIMARTDSSVSPHKGSSIFLAPIDTPGIKIIRNVPIMTEDFGGHVEIIYENVRVPHSAILGQEGQGFALTQARLGPARLTHCMRWTGIAQRALEIAAHYANTRAAFGSSLSEHQSIQWMLADSATELHAGRLMIQQAAWLLEKGEQARHETSMCKVFVSEAINRVIDRAIQICGGSGISRDMPLSQWYAAARAFRIYDGASEVHRMVIARGVLKQHGGGKA
jgi:acyl-CoA dehydrogenase